MFIKAFFSFLALQNQEGHNIGPLKFSGIIRLLYDLIPIIYSLGA